MAGSTTHYNLTKPAYEETADVATFNANMDAIDTALYGMKTKQTAKTDPTASSNAKAFIDSITQNENGEITATKKNVADMTGAGSSAAGANGLVPAPAAGDNTKFLRGDGTWAVPTDTTYGAATSSALGLIKTGYSASGKNYAVQLDASNKAYVNVPWTDNNTTYSEATSSAYGLIKIGYSASGKNYPVQLSSGKAYVNVPWSNTTYSAMTGATSSAAGASGLVPKPSAGDNIKYLAGDGTWKTPTNTTYSEATSSAYGLIKIGYTANGKNYPVQLSSGKAYVNVPWTDTNTTYSNFTGATSGAAGVAGLVPAPGSGKTNLFLRSSGIWSGLPVSTYFTSVSKEYNVSLSNLGSATVTASQFGFSTPSGYTPFGIGSIKNTSGFSIELVNPYATGSNTMMEVKNWSGMSMTGTLGLTVLYVYTG